MERPAKGKNVPELLFHQNLFCNLLFYVFLWHLNFQLEIVLFKIVKNKRRG